MISYDKYTILELKQICRDRNYKGCSKMSKAEIIDFLNSSMKTPTKRTMNIRKTPLKSPPTPEPSIKNLEITAKKLYKLVQTEIPSNGELYVKIGDVNFSPDMVDIVGGVIEVWVGKLIRKMGYYIRRQKESQKFPDYYLQRDEYTKGLLEIKAFNMYKGLNKDGSKRLIAPAFDLANFYSYVDTLKTESYKLNAHYLIFGYEWIGRGKFVIRKVWLYKITDLVGVDHSDEAKTNITGIQKKRGDFYNIRPLNFNSVKNERGIDNAAGNKKELIKAIYQTLMKGNKKDMYIKWASEVRENYYKYTGSYLFGKNVVDTWEKLYSTN